ncbi:helix-turn-helix transcriptional regulator [Clostridium oryzae]|uniref:HTH-type transcriptional activator Btr n=1 Tax=Clostridium oryzae TaxID=1450648 RepID=A0A1V4ICL6_9CLOT|nr:helix-turn-helix transcriptional regulator [Clostridium oryzae]OPJ57375.1 HTH-type transcriptional activator Btr [Clostridium oryzae]
MKNQLDDFLELFCLHVSKTIEKSTSWVVNRVIPYIQQNYYDPNLSLEQIGEQFNVHPVYVSKVFKDHVGKGVLDYINNLRIEHSKLLLEEKKNATIEQIAELVGYQNVRTFSRVFKKYTNISPGKYRNESL